MQVEHGVVEQLQALHLHLRAREAVDDDAVVVLRLEEFLEQQADHLAVADHLAGVLDRHRLRAGEQAADDDRRGGDVAGLGDERRVGALAGAGAPPSQMNSRGKRRLSRPCFSSRSAQTAEKMSWASLISRSATAGPEASL